MKDESCYLTLYNSTYKGEEGDNVGQTLKDMGIVPGSTFGGKTRKSKKSRKVKKLRKTRRSSYPGTKLNSLLNTRPLKK
jgi:hypothetical protein